MNTLSQTTMPIETTSTIQNTHNICNTTTEIPLNIFESSDFLSQTRILRKNYTPFGMEFKKISSTFLYNYGMNFSLEIPIVGNILHRALFEIELPVLNFSDSMITDTTYVQYKANNLSNISNEITKWTDSYTTMKNFSNIMFEVYVETKKILKLQNITLSFLQSRILNIINKYTDNLYTPKYIK